LAYCWFRLCQYENALDFLWQIENPTNLDYELEADIHWHLENWDAMKTALRSAHSINPSADTYYRLALAEGADRYCHQIDAASKEIMKSYLLKAITIGDCPVEAYLLLDDLHEVNDFNNRVNILNQAFQYHPDNFIVRFDLATTLLYGKKEYEKAIILLSPLLGTEESDQRARWHIFQALVYQKKYDEAFQYLDGISIKAENFIARIKDDLLFKQGKLQEWLISAAESIDNKSIVSLIRYYFRKVYINLNQNSLKQAIDDFKSGANLYLGSNISLDCLIEDFGDNHNFIYQEFDVTTDICETLILLKDDTDLVDQKTIGLLLYISHKHCCKEKQQDLLQFFPQPQNSLLLLSAKLLNFPPNLGYEIAQETVNVNFSQAIYYYLNCSISNRNSDEYILKIFADKLYNKAESRFNDDILNTSSFIQEIVLEALDKCKEKELIIKSLVPFYNNFYRKLLFETKSYKAIAEINAKIIEASDRSQGLFDYAYSSNYLGNQDKALTIYLELLSKQPNNTSVLNNLGLICESKRMLKESLTFFSKAFQIDSTSKKISSNYNRVKLLIDFRDRSFQKSQDCINKIKSNAANIGLSEEQLMELNEFYWESNITIKCIQEKFGGLFTSSSIYGFVFPHAINEKCPNCLIDLVYKNRSARNTDDKICIGCGHQAKGWCNCNQCKKVQEEQKLKAEKIRRQAVIDEFNNLKEQYCKPEYSVWAISKLSRREKMFLKAFMEVIESSENPTWEEICERAGVVTQKSYVKRLTNLKLLLKNPDGQFLSNSAIQISMLELESVRKISPSIRFDVFQRDNHVCQYCGRTPPAIKLVVDHLTPVAQGGTDIFENLVTSCEECNSGKSAKLIKDFTGGLNKEEWSQNIRAKYLDSLQKRREKLGEIKQYWASSLGKKNISDRDNTAIHNLIEIYEPDWIKLAIDIAVSRKIEDYVKYTAGILKNWSKEGLPEHISNPDSGLAKRPASIKQIAYINSLLERLEISLNDVIDKNNVKELTMLDARNLISLLIEQAED
jgi:predicted Zn-dependent protease